MHLNGFFGELLLFLIFILIFSGRGNVGFVLILLGLGFFVCLFCCCCCFVVVVFLFDLFCWIWGFLGGGGHSNILRNVIYHISMLSNRNKEIEKKKNVSCTLNLYCNLYHVTSLTITREITFSSYDESIIVPDWYYRPRLVLSSQTGIIVTDWYYRPRLVLSSQTGIIVPDWYYRPRLVLSSQTSIIVSDWYYRHRLVLSSQTGIIVPDWYYRPRLVLSSQTGIIVPDWYYRHRLVWETRWLTVTTNIWSIYSNWIPRGYLKGGFKNNNCFFCFVFVN